MDSIGDRIKAIRKDQTETQERFGVRIGLKRNSVAQIELGINRPSDVVIKAICREYGVRREWLLTGEGDMYPPEPDSDLERIARVMEGASENKKKLIRILADMPDELLDKMMEYLESKVK